MMQILTYPWFDRRFGSGFSNPLLVGDGRFSLDVFSGGT